MLRSKVNENSSLFGKQLVWLRPNANKWFLLSAHRWPAKSGPDSSRIRRNEITQHCTPVRLLPLARRRWRPLTGSACVVPVAVGGRPAGQRVPAGDRLSIGRPVRRGISISNHLYSSTHSCRSAAAGPPHPLGPDRPTLFLTYLFSEPAHRLIPLLCAFYFTQRSRSKWRKAIVDWCGGPASCPLRLASSLVEKSYTPVSCCMNLLVGWFIQDSFCDVVEQLSKDGKQIQFRRMKVNTRCVTQGN